MSWSAIAGQPVFIGGHRKSGTTLLGSLIGGNPKVFMCPGETGFFYRYYPILENGSFDDSRKKSNMDHVMESFDQLINEWIPEKYRPHYDFCKLKDNFWKSVKADLRPQNLHINLMQQIYEALGAQGNPYVYWAEKSTSMEIFSDTLFSWYPHCKMIHLLRDPRDNYASIKSGWEKHYQNQFDSLERLLQSVIDRALLGMRYAELNQKIYPDQYLVLRFEDLVADPEKEMRRICLFLKVEFDSAMLKPAFLESAWHGNSFESQSLSEVSSQNAGRWRERIHAEEAQVLEFYFAEVMGRFGYDRQFSDAECARAVRQHYSWFNYAQTYSLKIR